MVGAIKGRLPWRLPPPRHAVDARRRREDDDGNPVWLEPQFAHTTASTNLVNRMRPPSRYKARNLERVKLICDAQGLVETIMRGIERGLI